MSTEPSSRGFQVLLLHLGDEVRNTISIDGVDHLVIVVGIYQENRLIEEYMHMNDPASSENQPRKSRHLDWDGCFNVRDLGGLPTIDHGETVWRKVIRSDLPGRLTSIGQQAMLDYGVRTIIDLRAPQEVKKDAYTIAAPTIQKTPAYRNLPIEKYYPHVSALIMQAQSVAEVYCIILDYYPDAVVAILKAILNAQTGGVVIHCHSGKDRTGIITALLLSLAEVPIDVVAADYAESQECLWPRYEKYAADAGDKADTGLFSKPVAVPETIHLLFSHLETLYGGVKKYLGAVVMDQEEIQRLRRCLRNPYKTPE